MNSSSRKWKELGRLPDAMTAACVPGVWRYITGTEKQVIAIGKKTGCDVELHPEKKYSTTRPAFCSSAGMLTLFVRCQTHWDASI